MYSDYGASDSDGDADHYQNRGRGFNPRGRGFNPRGRGANPRGRGFDHRGRGVNPRGRGYDPHNPYPRRGKRVIPEGHFIPPKGSIYNKYKLQMCHKFEENQFWESGDYCVFAHSKEERRGYGEPVPDTVKELYNLLEQK